MQQVQENKGMSIRAFVSVPRRFEGWFEDVKNDKLRADFLKECVLMGESELCPCGSGLKHKECCPDIAKQSVIAELYIKLKALDEALKKAQRSQNVKSLCKAGCNDCCSDYFYISMPEYFLLKHRLEKDGLFQKIREIGRKEYEKLASECPDEFKRLEGKENQSFDEISNDKKYLSRFCVCPLSDCDKSCAAYHERPVICRFYGTVLGSGNFCSKILSKAQGFFTKEVSRRKLKKMCVSFQYDREHLITNMDYFHIGNQAVFVRPYPLVYWLANDNSYTSLYHAALTQTPENFIKLLLRIS